MYNSLGIHWASSIPAFLGAVCLPFPFLFYKFGPQIRRHCKYAAESARKLDEIAEWAAHASQEPSKETPSLSRFGSGTEGNLNKQENDIEAADGRV